jgi:hypothetical protein
MCMDILRTGAHTACPARGPTPMLFLLPPIIHGCLWRQVVRPRAGGAGSTWHCHHGHNGNNICGHRPVCWVTGEGGKGPCSGVWSCGWGGVWVCVFENGPCWSWRACPTIAAHRPTPTPYPPSHRGALSADRVYHVCQLFPLAFTSRVHLVMWQPAVVSAVATVYSIAFARAGVLGSPPQPHPHPHPHPHPIPGCSCCTQP